MNTQSKIKLPAEVKHLRRLIQFVSACIREQRLSSEKIPEIELAVEEAFVNICSYAYPEGSGDVEILCKKDNNKLVIKIIDEGIPFDVSSVPSPDMTGDISRRKVGGFGIHLIRNIVDELKYRREEKKNILTLIVYNK